MNAGESILELQLTKAVKQQMTFADASAKLTALAQEGWAGDLNRGAKAAEVLSHYFGAFARCRYATIALRSSQEPVVKRYAKLLLQSKKANDEFVSCRDRVVTFFVDEAYEKRESKLNARVAAGDFEGEGHDKYHGLSRKSWDLHERAKKRALSAHGVFMLT